jgi:hypothetical protein
MEGEVLISFLGPDCPYCKQWVKVANAIAQSSSLPSPFGVVAASREAVDGFIKDHGIRFPLGVISPSLMTRLARAVPTTALVVSGVITEIWVGQMPPEFVGRFRRAFFPDAPLPTTGLENSLAGRK